MNAAGLVLAAGRSSRYRAAGGDAETKLVATFRGEPLVRHVARAALGGGLDPVVVVTGYAAPAVHRALEGLAVSFVHNERFADGLSTSLAVGLRAVPARCAVAAVLLGDMPLLRPETLAALLDAGDADREADAIVPVTAGRRGNPVLLRRTLFARAAALAGDEGARRLLRDPAVRVRGVPVEGDAVLLDADDPAGLAALSHPGEARPAEP